MQDGRVRVLEGGVGQSKKGRQASLVDREGQVELGWSSVRMLDRVG